MGVMLTGHHLIYFAPETWDGLWRNRQQLMSLFARCNQVLYVEEIPRLKKVVKKVRQGTLSVSDFKRPPVRQVAESLFVFQYPLLGAHNNRPVLRYLTDWARRSALKKTLTSLKVEKPIVWIHRPEMVDMIDELPDWSMLIYHVVDEYSAYGGQSSASRQRTAEREQKLMEIADVVVVVSDELYKSKSPYNPNTYLVRNGVNFDAFDRALKDDFLPHVFQTIPQPRLGYSGSIGDRLDFEMLTEVALHHTDWSLVFLGADNVSPRARKQWEALKSLPNVYELGPVSADQVPYFVKGFNVGLMPYIQNNFSHNISPLKLYDYLAAGLPIACIDIPAVQDFAAHIHIAKNPQDFACALKSALADSSEERKRERIDLAKQNTWEARVDQLSKIIERHLV